MVRRTMSSLCLCSVRSNTGMKLALFGGAGRGQPSGPAYSRLSYGPFSFNELLLKAQLRFILKSCLKQLVPTVELAGKV